MTKSSIHSYVLGAFWVWCFILQFSIGSDGLKNVRLDAPRYVRKGQDMTLSCLYDIDTRSLYAVKWYRGSDEFARYLPKEIPPQQVFPQQGITVNITHLTGHQVHLTNISYESAGIYKCVATAEASFKTLSDEQEVIVVVIGYESPKLYMDQLDYSYGDTARANCSVEANSPPANISWYIDNELVPREKSVTYLKPEPSNPEVTTSISTFSFVLPESSTTYVRLKCTGHLYDIYNMSSEMTIPLRPRRMSMMSTSSDTLTKRYNDTSRGQPQRVLVNFGQVLQICLLMFTLLLMWKS